MSEGRVCPKGLSGIQALYHPNRNKYPMKRVGERGGNQWERISWEEAIDTIADALMDMKDKPASKVSSAPRAAAATRSSSARRVSQLLGRGQRVRAGLRAVLPAAQLHHAADQRRK
ncbi:MAG: molybdopterin-dependent oxidoreductase [Eggerthellaceae bacterium]